MASLARRAPIASCAADASAAAMPKPQERQAFMYSSHWASQRICVRHMLDRLPLNKKGQHWNLGMQLQPTEHFINAAHTHIPLYECKYPRIGLRVPILTCWAMLLRLSSCSFSMQVRMSATAPMT